MSLVFNIDRRLRSYFPDPTAFRDLQAQTGTLISGSTALQFFLRTLYVQSDLDLYVQRAARFEVGRWLLATGYNFVPTGAQPLSFELCAAWPPTDVTLGDYPGMLGVAAVYTFKRNSKTVQVIAAVHAPMEVILMHHSCMTFFP